MEYNFSTSLCNGSCSLNQFVALPCLVKYQINLCVVFVLLIQKVLQNVIADLTLQGLITYVDPNALKVTYRSRRTASRGFRRKFESENVAGSRC